MLSAHTCPLAALGGWETGGMNVYVRELSRALGRQGIAVDVFTRRQDPAVPRVVEFGPGARVTSTSTKRWNTCQSWPATCSGSGPWRV